MSISPSPTPLFTLPYQPFPSQGRLLGCSAGLYSDASLMSLPTPMASLPTPISPSPQPSLETLAGEDSAAAAAGAVAAASPAPED